MKLLAPILILLLIITSGIASVITSGAASALPKVPRENIQPMEPAMEPVGVDWMGIWVSYWWLIVIGIGVAIGSGLSFVFTRGLI